jgi:nucleotide-binding universal stress UspA family protein
MIKTILVPTDGSDHACKAVTFASDIASKYEARVQLLHVALKDASLKTIRRVADIEKLSKDSLDELDRSDAMEATANQATSIISLSVPVLSELIEDAGNAILYTAERQGARRDRGQPRFHARRPG